MISAGHLFVISTPIGNLSDLSPRAAETLRTVDLVAAEDTRHTRKLLSHLDVGKPMLRCDEAAEERATAKILETLSQGKTVALVSDAGTPGVSDPGARLLHQVHEAGYSVITIPGPSAVTAALAASGFRATPFQFFGFLPRKGGDRQRAFEAMAETEGAKVFFEAPPRLVKTLAELADRIPDRMACVAREMTKVYEEFARGTLKTLAARFAERNVRGEVTVVVEGVPAKEARRKRREASKMRKS